MSEHAWTIDQQSALGSLERAFARCAAAGICFVGMDQNLIAYDAKSLDTTATAHRHESLYEAQVDNGQGETVNTSGAYRESGGW